MTDLSSLLPERPKYLYKYCPASRAARILEDLHIFLAPIKCFNDTFEFAFLGLLTENEDTPRDYFTKNLAAKGVEPEMAREVLVNMGEEKVRSYYEEWKNEVLVPVLRKIRKHSGVTCFSAEEDNQRMWAAYADDNRGVCMEFAVGREDCPFEGWLIPVLYSGTKVGLTVADLINDDMTLSTEVLIFLSAVKHEHFRDEREWRVLFLDNEERGGNSRKLPLSSATISRVFLGPRIAPADEAAIRRIVEQRNLDVPVFRRSVDGLFGTGAWEGFEIPSSPSDVIYWLKRQNPKLCGRIETLSDRNSPAGESR